MRCNCLLLHFSYLYCSYFLLDYHWHHTIWYCTSHRWDDIHQNLSFIHFLLFSSNTLSTISFFNSSRIMTYAPDVMSEHPDISSEVTGEGSNVMKTRNNMKRRSQQNWKVNLHTNSVPQMHYKMYFVIKKRDEIFPVSFLYIIVMDSKESYQLVRFM